MLKLTLAFSDLYSKSYPDFHVDSCCLAQPLQKEYETTDDEQAHAKCIHATQGDVDQLPRFKGSCRRPTLANASCRCLPGSPYCPPPWKERRLSQLLQARRNSAKAILAIAVTDMVSF